MERRTFIKHAGGAGAAVLSGRVASALGAGGDIRVGVITEPGGAHLNLFVRALGRCEGVDTVALADPSGQTFERSRSALGARAASARTFADYREMLRAHRPGLVVITLEPVHTPEAISAALEAGCHVLAEKPPSVRQADFDRVVDLAEARQRQLMLAFASRVSPAARKARQLVEQGALGKLYGASMTWIADQTRLRRPEYHKTWTAQKARAGGGQWIFHGVHYIDLVQYIAGDSVARVAGFVGNVGGQPLDVEDAAAMALEFRGGMVATLNAGYYVDKNYDNRFRLWGSDGWLRLGYTSEALPFEWYSSRPGAAKEVQVERFPAEPDEYHTLTAEAVAAARGLGKAPMTPAECRSVMRTAFAGYRAADSGRTEKVS
jgi:predicted dehydrogenase